MGRKRKRQDNSAEKYDSREKWDRVETAVALFKKRTESFVTIAIGAASVAAAGAAITSLFNPSKPKTDFDSQIVRLKETEASLNDLVKFVRDQQSKLKDSEAVLSTLQKEHEKLKPVVEADRSIVEAILAAQSESQRLNVWYERMIGFLIGIAGSLVASFVWSFVVKKLQNREVP